MKKNKLKYILRFNWAIISILLLGFFYIILFNPNSYIITINSVKVASEYQSLKNKEKRLTNDTETLIQENIPLYQTVDSNNTSIEEKFQAITKIQENTNNIIQKLYENKEIHEKLIILELPEDLNLEITDGYNEIETTLQKFTNHNVYLQAQVDYLKIRVAFEKVESCIHDIDYNNLSDNEISNNIKSCTSNYSEIISQIESVENTYNESLTSIKAFVNETGEKYKNSELLYQALSDENFENSKRFHRLYSESEEELKKMDTGRVWFEYKSKILDKLWSEG